MTQQLQEKQATTQIAAAIESIDKVGPFVAHFKLDAIDDVRSAKKKEIVDRAKDIVQKWSTKTISEGDEMLKDVSEGGGGKLVTFGREKLSCGSGVFDSPWIIIVEGRADISATIGSIVKFSGVG